MPTWRQLRGQSEGAPVSLVGPREWEGIVVCNNACVVRAEASLDSPLVRELPPGTCVSVVQEGEAGGRQRLCLSAPCSGWVSAKLVRKTANAWSEAGNSMDVVEDNSWQPLGMPTFFPDASANVTAKTPMGRPVELFDGNPEVDRSFGSPAAMYTDRVEMALWISRRVGSFNSSLGDEVKASMFAQVGELQAPSQPSGAPKKYRPQVLYIAGVEGTGHHGVMPMLLYPAVRQFGSGTISWWRSLREVLMKTPPSRRKARLHQLLDAMGVFDRPHFIVEWCSWPFGEDVRGRWSEGCDDPNSLQREERSGNPGNSVDLREFVELFQTHGDVKVLVLHRGLASAAWSHKEWDDGLVEHAKVLALFNDYLTRVLRKFDADMWRWVAYEDLCEAHVQQDFSAIKAIADFLGLQRGADLERVFRHFRPSRKDASSEMSPENLRAIRRVEEEKCQTWFPSAFPAQRLLAQFSPSSGKVRKLLQPAQEQDQSTKDSQMGLDPTNPAFIQFLASMTEVQKQAWLAVCQSQADPQESAVLIQRLQQSLSEDQVFLFRKALLREEVSQRVDQADVDPGAYTCLHMWIEDRGFGSEINNLISASIFCKEHELSCVVEDEAWNSGQLHSYLQAEPLMLRRCPHSTHGRCRQLDVRRNKRVATPGWFAVCKHAKKVSFAEKAKVTRQVWRYTSDTANRIDLLNEEFDLPTSYVAVHVRCGDKVAGKRKESVSVTTADYAKEALSHLGRNCSVIAVCTDDLSAAEEFGEAVRKLRPMADVRWRSRKDIPEELRHGHWQADYNALRVEDRVGMTQEFLADVEVLRGASVTICTYSSNVGRLVALLRDGPTVSMDQAEWTND